MSRRPVRIELTEQPGWSEWDPAGELGNRISDLAWEHFTGHISEGICEEQILDLAAAARGTRKTKQDWSSRRISTDDAELICVALRDGNPDLELTRATLVGALTEAYEEALMPSDQDIRDAVDAAIEKMAETYDLDQDFWAPLLDKGAEPEEIVREFFEHTIGGVFAGRQVTYERKPGWYERYLVFDFWKSSPVKALLKALPEDWDMRSTLLSLEGDFKTIIDAFLSRFFEALSKEMKAGDPTNRLEWRRIWKDIVSGRRAPGSGGYAVGHEPTLEDVRKEMLSYLDEARKEQEAPEDEG